MSNTRIFLYHSDRGKRVCEYDADPTTTAGDRPLRDAIHMVRVPNVLPNCFGIAFLNPGRETTVYSARKPPRIHLQRAAQPAIDSALGKIIDGPRATSVRTR